MSPDIIQKIKLDFEDNSPAALEMLENYEESVGPRILRSIVKLAEGDLEQLKEYMKAAIIDWRDVIFWAEEKPYQFNEPFEFS